MLASEDFARTSGKIPDQISAANNFLSEPDKQFTGSPTTQPTLDSRVRWSRVEALPAAACSMLLRG